MNLYILIRRDYIQYTRLGTRRDRCAQEITISSQYQIQLTGPIARDYFLPCTNSINQLRDMLQNRYTFTGERNTGAERNETKSTGRKFVHKLLQ